MNENTEFWIIWQLNSSSSCIRYPTREEANQQANHFARLYPGKQFFVLRAERFFEAEAIVKTTALELSEEPTP